MVSKKVLESQPKNFRFPEKETRLVRNNPKERKLFREGKSPEFANAKCSLVHPKSFLKKYASKTLNHKGE